MIRAALAVALAAGVAYAAPHKKSSAKPAPKAAAKGAPKTATKTPAPRAAVERLADGYRRFIDGDYRGARRALEPLVKAPLLNRDYAVFFLAQSELLDSAPAAAVEHFRAVAALGGRFGVIARWRSADALWAAGRRDEARRAYEAALPTPSDAVEPAVAHFRIAEAEAANPARAAAAAARFRKVWLEYPLHPLAEAARARIGAPPTAAEHIARAKLMTADRAWPRALDELAEVPADAPPAVRDEADYWIGTTRFKMRHGYDIAAQKLLSVWSRLPGDERKAEALFHGARALSRADRDDEAIVGYRDVLAKFPHSHQAAEASFLIGWLDFNRGRYKEAIPGLEATLKRFGSTQWEDDARWYLGFARWLSGDNAGALADFEKLAAHGGALTGGKGAYWRGRALVKLKRADEAQAVWRRLVGEYPLTFYAQLARVRLAELGAPIGPFGDVKPRGAPPLGAVDAAAAADPLIARADELLAAGLSVEAGVELRRGEADYIKRWTAVRALPVLFDRYARGDDFHRPHQLAEAHAGGALQSDPQADPTVRAWWEEVYPRAYRAFIEKYGPTGDNPPYYLYTIMQKESAYNPHDVSYADAIGLLQMIPPTSRQVAAHIDTPYTDDVLYDPEGNIRFGAWYIGHLLKKFKGQIAVGAGSFNAGPRAMRKWLQKNGDHPLDEFVELCSYTQTREYMKKALDIYARYLYLYEKDDYLPSLKVDPVPLDDGIDY